MSDSLWPHESQHARPPCPSPTPRVHSDSRPSSQWCHPAISSSVISFSSCPQSLPASSLFQWVSSSHEVAKVLEFQLQHHSFQRTPRADLLQNGLVGSPCSPRDSQESSPAPQFKRLINLPKDTQLAYAIVGIWNYIVLIIKTKQSSQGLKNKWINVIGWCNVLGLCWSLIKFFSTCLTLPSPGRAMLIPYQVPPSVPLF